MEGGGKKVDFLNFIRSSKVSQTVLFVVCVCVCILYVVCILVILALIDISIEIRYF